MNGNRERPGYFFPTLPLLQSCISSSSCILPTPEAPPPCPSCTGLSCDSVPSFSCPLSSWDSVIFPLSSCIPLHASVHSPFVSQSPYLNHLEGELLFPAGMLINTLPCLKHHSSPLFIPLTIFLVYTLLTGSYYYYYYFALNFLPPPPKTILFNGSPFYFHFYISSP